MQDLSAHLRLSVWNDQLDTYKRLHQRQYFLNSLLILTLSGIDYALEYRCLCSDLFWAMFRVVVITTLLAARHSRSEIPPRDKDMFMFSRAETEPNTDRLQGRMAMGLDFWSSHINKYTYSIHLTLIRKIATTNHDQLGLLEIAWDVYRQFLLIHALSPWDIL